MIHATRIKKLNNYDINKQGDYVLYWMQAAQRAEDNLALEYAIKQANELKKPLIVCFGLTDHFPEANIRHYHFMLQGLQEVGQALHKRGIKFLIRKESPERAAVKMAENASLIIGDRGYLKIEKEWRRYVQGRINSPLIQVETNVVVPIEEASNKEEYAAYTIRPKINKQLDDYLIGIKERTVKNSSLDFDFQTFKISDIQKAFAELNIDKSVPKSDYFKGGTSKAKRLLKSFITKKLEKYADLRNDPSKDYLSHMSPYLHFGQISPRFIALQISKTADPGKEAYLEELIIRRELSMNFVFYNEHYDDFERILPHWAKKTLEEHRKDEREYLYSLEEFEQAKTHDPYWNAAQTEMVKTGKMHGYLRMYWGKKILEWTENPQKAHEIALYLNNKYELDGRDPNGFTGVAWCFGKHDRAWKERPIFGKVRYMNARGLERKFDINSYVEKIQAIN
ncbi:MAG: deoxyribodipyrimidine photo-lyase [Candidatus Heimdallarchaeota archaeon]|nr:deoxyribodipyrimidine photo-lyase [Candidatus Heimdallarchaeota archaeon]